MAGVNLLLDKQQEHDIVSIPEMPPVEDIAAQMQGPAHPKEQLMHVDDELFNSLSRNQVWPLPLTRSPMFWYSAVESET